MKKRTYITLMFVFIGLFAKGQIDIFKTNSEANFKILMESVPTKNGLSISVFRIRLTNFENDSIRLKDIDIKKALELLDNKNYDWYVNLLLYDITNKSAMVYFGFKIMNRDIWVEEFYESDINYWKKELMQLQNSQ